MGRVPFPRGVSGECPDGRFPGNTEALGPVAAGSMRLAVFHACIGHKCSWAKLAGTREPGVPASAPTVLDPARRGATYPAPGSSGMLKLVVLKSSFVLLCLVPLPARGCQIHPPRAELNVAPLWTPFTKYGKGFDTELS